jgi:SAM-dependent methyltransferase
MDITSEQFKLLKDFIQKWHKDKKLELETTFGSAGIVDSTTFLQIAQRMRNKGYAVTQQDDRLSIITPNHIRLSLQGLGIIQSYCKDNSIQGKPFSAMFKDRAFPDSNVDLREYDVRFKIRREEQLSDSDPRVVALITNWNNQRKAFRLIRRWSYIGNGVRIDMSMVRQTQYKHGKNEFDWVTSFLQRDIFQEAVHYEVEVELVHDTEYTTTPEIALKSLISGVGDVLRAIQNNSLLIRNSIANTVRSEYHKFINSDRFRGVCPITLEAKNMLPEIVDSVPNIRSGFNVTDKADGLRTMAFVNKDGDLYLIDMSMRVYKTGLKNKKCANSLIDGEWVTITKQENNINHYLIFDIYYYEGKSVSGSPFITFQDNIINKDDNSRYNTMHKWYNTWNDGNEVTAKGVSESNKLLISLKHFEFATPNNTSIFKACANVLDTTRIYNTDGLILTSNTEPIPDKSGVRWNHQFKWKPAKDNTIDFLINYERNTDIPTIHKITTAIHPTTNNTIQYKTMRLFVGGSKDTSVQNPRLTILLQQPIQKDKDAANYRPILFNPTDYPDTMANTCNILIQIDPETGEEYCITEDSNEPISDRSIVEMRYDPSRDPGWRWVPTRIRHDKTERLQKAMSKPGPTKYIGTLNNENTANSIWNSIHNPVTDSMIRTGNEQPTEDEIKDIIKTIDSDVSKKYYERKAPEENIMLVRGLLDFHNKYIKNEILLKRVLRGGNKHLLDLACGKGGDLFKWLFNKARYVVGIDTAGDNITDPNNGAYRRYLDAIAEFGYERVPKIAFVIGNSSKNIISGEAGSTPEEQDILRNIFGKFPTEGPVPKYVENIMSGSFRAGADIAACMFALHYFFENKETLNGLLTNLSETVKIGGYFVGCCFDGDRVFNLLRGVDKGHSKIGQEGDVPIWKITKDYDNEDLTTDDDSIGLGIDVEFISIGTTHKEYIVPFDLFKKKLSNIGFELLDKDNLHELGLSNSTNTFDVSYQMAEKAGKKFVMSEPVKEFSFLNRWFIFKRVGETAVPELPKITLAENTEQSIQSLRPMYGVVESKERDDDTDKAVDKEDMGDRGDMEEDKLIVGNEKAVAEKVGINTGAKLPSPDKKFSEIEIFRFGSDARQVDIGVKDDTGKKDINVSRWLALSAPFPIPDPDEPEIKYPSIEHYLAAMKFKFASSKPSLARDLMSTIGKVHQEFATKRRIEKVKSESPRDFELLAEEAADIRKKMTKTYLNQYRVAFDESKWIPVKDKVLMDALKYRWEHDKRFRDTVDTVRNAGKYLLYSSRVASVASELGGTRDLSSGKIMGENKVGRFIMEIAGFRF